MAALLVYVWDMPLEYTPAFIIPADKALAIETLATKNLTVKHLLVKKLTSSRPLSDT